MKKKKNKPSIVLSILLIVFLISSSSLNTSSVKTPLDKTHNQYNTDSFDRTDWKWSTTEVVSTESTGWSEYPSHAVDSAGNMHIAWEDWTDYNGAGTDMDIFYKRWNSSSSWTTTEVVSTESTGHSQYPSLAVDSAGNIYIAWRDLTDYAGAGSDADIFYKCWEASTSSWTATEVVSTESTGDSWHPSLAVDAAGNIHITWRDDTDYAGAGMDPDIFHKRWDASSSSWTATEVVSTESTSTSYFPSLAVDYTGNIYITWHDVTDYAGAGTDKDIFYKCWEASTSSWTATEVVSTESTADSQYPSLAVDYTGNIYITWYDTTNYASAGPDWDIFYKRWEASTSLWTTTEVVSTESTADSHFPSLAVDYTGNIYIAWHDWTDYAGAGSDLDIFYKCWDSSSSWTITEVVSTESTANSFSSSLTVDSAKNVYIAWEDITDFAGAGTDWDIFYKLLAGPPAAPELAFIVPNPTELDTVNLDWNNVLGATTYYVYRSTSYIWSVEGLLLLATVSSSDYVDTLPSEGFYYYVVIAENFAGNSSHSNCQYVEVSVPDLDSPELSPILPNPTEISSISLVWDSVNGATEYYIYRSTSYIWSVEGLTPISTVGLISYDDILPSEGCYFYVIVASDGLRNSTHSNCEYIEYKLPILHEFVIVSSLILATSVLVFVVMRIRKKNSKVN